MPHPEKTLFADRVVYQCPEHGAHVAFVIKVHSDHCATLVYYCPHDHAWKEASSVCFGKTDAGAYFVNPDA